MSLPIPRPGLVIRYSYLWAREHAEGREEGVKDRPCAVLVATRTDQGDLRVIVLPITHAPPGDPEAAVEIPPATKRRLGLDDVAAAVASGTVGGAAASGLAEYWDPVSGDGLGAVPHA